MKITWMKTKTETTKLNVDNAGIVVTGTKGTTIEINVTSANKVLKKKMNLLNKDSFFTYQSSLPALNKKSFSALDKLS